MWFARPPPIRSKRSRGRSLRNPTPFRFNGGITACPRFDEFHGQNRAETCSACRGSVLKLIERGIIWLKGRASEQDRNTGHPAIGIGSMRLSTTRPSLRLLPDGRSGAG
jgi:hypothetical protein